MILFHAHSGVRYLVVLFGIVALAYALWGAVRGREYDARMRVFAGLFAATLHLQILLGLALVLLGPGQFYPQLAGHIVMMVFAAVVAQIVPSVMRRREMEERSYLPHAVSVVVALGLVWAGVAAIGRPLIPGLF